VVLACGIDIEEHKRFLKFFGSKKPAHFFHSIFTKDEIENYSIFNTPLCFAVSFSCKEAFYKAFSSAFNNVQIDWLEVELVFHDEPGKGEAELKFSGAVLELSLKNDLIFPPDFSYSISDSHVIFETVLECDKN
jgi:phosphopantetheine--protein transferase-like protein